MVCEKIMRPHTKKIYIPKSSALFTELMPLMPASGESKEIAREYYCSNCDKKHSETAILHHGYGRHDSIVMHLEVTLNKYFVYSTCSEECQKRKEEIRAEKRRIRSKHQAKVRKIRDDILNLFGSECFFCGHESSLEMHHIKEVSSGGSSDVSNLVPACKECHKILSNCSNESTNKWDNVCGRWVLNRDWVTKRRRMIRKLSDLQKNPPPEVLAFIQADLLALSQKR